MFSAASPFVRRDRSWDYSVPDLSDSGRVCSLKEAFNLNGLDDNNYVNCFSSVNSDYVTVKGARTRSKPFVLSHCYRFIDSP